MNKMRSIKMFQRLGLVLVAGFAFVLSIFFTQPSDATTVYKQMIALGLVNGIATPQQLNLEYLAQQPSEIIANSPLMDSIRSVSQAVSRMPEEIAFAIPLGTNKPIRIGQLQGDSGSSTSSDYDATGFVDSQNQPRDITPGNVEDMTKTELSNGGNLPAIGKAQNILLADASGRFHQARRVPTIKLIVRNRKTGNRYVVKGVNANAFCRDVLNAFLNNTVKRI